MLDQKQILTHLISLTKLDIDAVRAYDDAIKKIDLDEVKQQLLRFRGDHERHITDLSAATQQLGGTPPERVPDLKGLLIEGFTALLSATGTAGALSAMKTNEKLTTSTYRSALALDLPAELKALVQRNFNDEERHLQYIEDAVANKVWEKAKKIA